MKGISKRIYALLVTVCMTIGLLPSVAFAAATPVTSLDAAEKASSNELSIASNIIESSGGSYDLTGKTITINGTITISADVTITGGTIMRAGGISSFKGRMFKVNSGATLTLTGVTVDGGAEWEGTEDTVLGRGTTNSGIKATGPIIDAGYQRTQGGKVILNSGTVLQNNCCSDSGDGGAITIGEDGSLTINAGAIIRNNAKTDGQAGAIKAYAGADITMNGGEIYGNQADRHGGAIQIFGNDASTEVGYHKNVTFTMEGGTIRNNKAGGVGGAVAVSNYSTFEMKGGTIKDNATTDNDKRGGGVGFGDANTSMSISGSATITGNIAGGQTNNLYVGSNSNNILTVGTLSGANIGITMASLGVFSSGGADYAGQFKSDKDDYAVVPDGNNLKLAKTYSVTISSSQNGTITADKDAAAAGETVTLTFTPDAGYEVGLISVTANGSNVTTTAVVSNQCTFAMPAGNVTVSATFSEKSTEPPTGYNLLVGGEEVTDENLSGAGWAYEPRTKTLTLTNATINGNIAASGDDLNIVFSGTNTVKGYIGASNFNDTHYALNISGTGSLTATSSNPNGAIMAGSITLGEGLQITAPEGGQVQTQSGMAYIGNNSGTPAESVTLASSTPADTTAPILSDGSVERTSDTGATVSFTSDEAGTYYYLVAPEDAAAPSSADLVIANGTGGSCVNGSNTISLTGLAANAKTVYLAAKDATGNVSNMLTIDIPAYVPAPELTAGEVSRTSGAEATVKFTSSQAGQYTYYVVPSGSTGMVGTTTNGTCVADENTITLTDLTAGAKDIHIRVTNADGKYSDLKITIPAYEAPAAVTGVTISPDTATVTKGGTQQFIATVTGTGSFDDTVSWSISGNAASGTTISDSGLLTVAADETAETIRVIATANGDSTKVASATVTVESPATIPYLDANGVQQNCTNPTKYTGQTTLSTGWYYVDGTVSTSSRIKVSGDVHLILCDGATLTASSGVTVHSNNSLTIYGQKNCTGKLTANASINNAGIGGTYSTCGNITINGGIITSSGGINAAGIGGGAQGTCSNVTINGGIVTATGGNDGAGIGSGYGASGVLVTINGGTVIATNGSRAAGIGMGYRGSGSMTVTINGGSVKASSVTTNDSMPNNSNNQRVYLSEVTIPAGYNPNNLVIKNADDTDYSYGRRDMQPDANGKLYLWLPKDVTVSAPTEPVKYTITASASNDSLGSVTGGGTYKHGDTVTLVATADSQAAFLRWEENGQTVSTQATYSFTVEANRSLTAVFTDDVVIVSPTEDQVVTVKEGETATFSIEANNANGYEWFVDKNDGKGFVSISGADSDRYTTPPVTTDNNGWKYYCKCINDADTDTVSPTFTLQVNADPDDTIPTVSASSGIDVEYLGGNRFSTSRSDVPTSVEIDGVPVGFSGSGRELIVSGIPANARWITIRWNSTSVTTNFTHDGAYLDMQLPKTGDVSVVGYALMAVIAAAGAMLKK